jgi:hypothetical protein
MVCLVSYSVQFYDVLVGSEDAEGICWMRAFGNGAGLGGLGVVVSDCVRTPGGLSVHSIGPDLLFESIYSEFLSAGHLVVDLFSDLF